MFLFVKICRYTYAFLFPPLSFTESSILYMHFKASYFLMFVSRWWMEKKKKEEHQRWDTELKITIPQTLLSITFAVFTTSSCHMCYY